MRRGLAPKRMSIRVRLGLAMAVALIPVLLLGVAQSVIAFNKETQDRRGDLIDHRLDVRRLDCDDDVSGVLGGAADRGDLHRVLLGEILGAFRILLGDHQVLGLPPGA